MPNRELFPHVRGKESMFPQVDVRIRSGAYAPGYPAVNDTYNPDTNYGGTSTNNLIKGPKYAGYYQFHELGHQYPFPKFPGETEAEVKLLHVAVWNRGFGYDMNAAFRGSRGDKNTFRTLDTTAVEWMASFSFVKKQPMNQLEKQYQLKGHAKQWDDTYGTMFTENTAAAMRSVIDDLIGRYFPTPYITNLKDRQKIHKVVMRRGR